MEARMLTKASHKLNISQIQDFIIPCTEWLFKKEIVFYGFYYEEGEGIYLVGPREELKKVENKNGIEDFDFTNYIKTTNHQVYWIMDWWSDPDNPQLKQYSK